MKDQELAEMKAQRFFILGALSEQPDELAKVNAAGEAIKNALAQHEDSVGSLALMLVALEVGIAAGEQS